MRLMPDTKEASTNDAVDPDLIARLLLSAFRTASASAAKKGAGLSTSRTGRAAFTGQPSREQSLHHRRSR